MLVSTEVRGTPDWYLLRLGPALDSEIPRLARLNSYDTGDHPVPTGNMKMRQTFLRFQRQARTNYTGLIAESVRERCRPLGFVSGGDGTQTLDRVAWDIWQANYLDSECATVHHNALALSRAYVMVGPNPDDSTKPYITSESPFQVIHEYDPLKPRVVAAAIKVWFDPIQNRTQAFVYLPNMIAKYESDREGDYGYRTWDATAWNRVSVVSNPIGEVPIVPFINRRERGGMGEFEDVTDIQDRINSSVLQRLVIQEIQAFRQRWVKGVQLEDENGNPLRPFDPGADLLWHVEEADAMFGDFQQSDLGPLITAISADVQDMAAISRTPPHYLLASVANVSGDALGAAEVGLTSKVRDRLKEFGEGWEKVLRIAGGLAGAQLPDDGSMVWADPERHTLAEISDAVSKFGPVGFPFEFLAQLTGADPQTIERLVAMKQAEQQQKLDQQRQQLELQKEFAPPPPPAGQPPAGGPPKPPAGKPQPAKPAAK